MMQSIQRLRRRFSVGRSVVAGVLVVAALALALAAMIPVKHTASSAADGFAFKKGDPDMVTPGGNKRALVGLDETRWPDYTPEVEAYLLRAYPEAEVPGEATLAARDGWATLNAGAHSTGAWQLIGPSKPTYPAVLNPFLFDGAQYVAKFAECVWTDDVAVVFQQRELRGHLAAEDGKMILPEVRHDFLQLVIAHHGPHQLRAEDLLHSAIAEVAHGLEAHAVVRRHRVRRVGGESKLETAAADEDVLLRTGIHERLDRHRQDRKVGERAVCSAVGPVFRRELLHEPAICVK